ncbi:uroporphyrinogen decarboxylase family protein [Clostridium grantii]|uniref:Uroporphyrinogen decarboxylase n=1 Tax=Clostridium grantii DSM 8605 TaxID=1121316 RepID=A0A1M5WZG1_9CLOT|nr:uroporphyrinogen decarboxylase family protein [Clostridium grantii]SHH92967.1 uroporphyrinogen decarboxylase [Clostridium grantii DSM 8605]
MTRRERVIKALNHEQTDIIPFNADFTMQSDDIMVKFTNDIKFKDKLDLHLNYVQYWGWPTELEDKPENFKDTFGVVWDRSGADKDIGMPLEKIIDDFENIEYVFPEIDEVRLRAEYEELLKNREDKFTFAGIGFSMFERAWSLAGMPEVLMAMVLYPEGLHKLLDMICDYNLKVMDIALEYDIDGFYFGDDWGQQKGLIMGPDFWREFIKPRMKRMYAKAKEKGLYVLQHSCGDVESIFEDLIEIGLDCYQTFQPEIYDIEKVKEKFGDRLAFWGGISTQQLLPKASPEEIKKETIRIMKIMGKNGGYIAAPTHALEFDVPPENIQAMFEVFMNQEKYLK